MGVRGALFPRFLALLALCLGAPGDALAGGASASPGGRVARADGARAASPQRWPEAPEPPPGGYALGLSVDVEGGILRGESRAMAPCARWALPVNRFQSPPIVGGELLTRRVYPQGFAPITLAVEGVPGLLDGAGALFTADAPVSRLPFTLTLAERQGATGIRRGQITLQGGFAPIPLCGVDPWEVDGAGGIGRAALAPRPVALDVRLEGGEGAALIGGMGLPTPGGVVALGPEAMVTLVASPRLQRLDLGVPGLSLYGEGLGRRQRGGLKDAFTAAVEAWRRWGLPLPEGGAVVALAPMLQSLTLEGGGVMLLSTQAMRLHPRVRRAHEVPLTLGLFRHLLLEAVIPPGWPAHRRLWLADAAAAHLARRLEAERRGDALDAEGLIRPLAFLPGFDQLLYAPRMPFAQEVYGNPFILDPVDEDLRHFLHPMAPGRALLVKIADRFGAPAALALVEATLGGEDPIPFAAAAAPGATEGEVAAFIQGWEGPHPHQDLALVRAEGPGRAFVVERRSEDALPEEVILIAPGDPTDLAALQTWIAPALPPGAPPARSPVITPEGRAPVSVDPLRHVLEMSPDGLLLRGNNRAPPDWKIIVGGVTQSLSFQQRRFDVSGGVSFMPRYDRRHLVSVDAFTDDLTLLGVVTGYFHYFGAPRDAVWRRQRLGVYGKAALNRSAFEPGVAQVLGAGLSYRYESRQDLFDPRRGARLTLSAEGGQVDYAPSAAALGAGLLEALEPGGLDLGAAPVDAARPYGILAATGVLLRDPWATGVLGLRASLGTGIGEARPDLFYLGGGGAIRGLAADVQGARRALAGVELRQSVVDGVMVDLGLVHLTKLALVGFVDVGGVGAGALAEPLVGLGVGGGARLHLRALGLQPGLFGLDVAWGGAWDLGDVGDGGPGRVEPRPQVYLRFAQAF